MLLRLLLLWRGRLPLLRQDSGFHCCFTEKHKQHNHIPLRATSHLHKARSLLLGCRGRRLLLRMLLLWRGRLTLRLLLLWHLLRPRLGRRLSLQVLNLGLLRTLVWLRLSLRLRLRLCLHNLLTEPSRPRVVANIARHSIGASF